MDVDPTDDQLLAFATSLLSGLGPQLRDPALLSETLHEQRELWVMLYHASLGIQWTDRPPS